MSLKLTLTTAAALLASAPAMALSPTQANEPATAQVIPLPAARTQAAVGPDLSAAAPSRDDAAAQASPSQPAPLPDLMQAAAADPRLSTLAAALLAAGLADTLKGPGPFTLFAPSNEAFAKLPPGALDTLLKPAGKADLTRLLTYHVIPAAMLTADVTGATAAPASVAGPTLAVDGRNGLLVNGARVIGGQTVTANGVIHVIDTVLDPGGP
jgi:uncharacterized surface protein with fasciclin (FAS1) repeats